MPTPHVVNGAVLICSMGAAPSNLMVMPVNRLLSGNQPAANIMDHKPMVNILPFKMCLSPANPTVAAATIAALGVFTPMPCIPITPAPWAPGSPNVLVGNLPAVNQTCTCNCVWGGIIQPVFAGQVTELVG
jgi:hypothetical protein